MYARSLHRLTILLLIAFLAIAISATYWSIFAADSLLSRTDNPRLSEAEQAVDRGRIYDQQGRLLADSVLNGTTLSGSPLYQRTYPQFDALSATGFYSIAGRSGVEDAFNSVLRGDTTISADQRSLNQLLHRSPVGSDLQLTIDLSIQQAAAQAMRQAIPSGTPTGAVVVIDAQSGAIRTLLSLPTFDPTAFNDVTRFNQLVADPSSPLFNRAIQGAYPPGSALQTIILSTLIGDQTSLTAPISGAGQAVNLSGLTLNCVQASIVQTLQDAYANACPAPFGQAAFDHPADVQQAINNFGLSTAPVLAGFALPVPPHIQQLEAMVSNQSLMEAQGVGQGLLSVSPLQMAIVAATIANHGQAQPLHLVEATRTPGEQWTPVTNTDTPIAVTSQPIADTVRQLMQYAVTNGTAKGAAQTGLTIYGHAAIAYTGPNKMPIAWFIGFVDVPNGHSLAIAVTLEGVADPSTAALIGGQVLKVAETEAVQPAVTPASK